MANMASRQQYLAENPGSFPHLAHLPPELRTMIWEFAAKPNRVHYFGWSWVRTIQLSMPFSRDRLISYAEYASQEPLSLESPQVHANLNHFLGWPRSGIMVTAPMVNVSQYLGNGIAQDSHNTLLERAYLARISQDRTECKRGRIHVCREARHAISSSRPVHSMHELNLRAMARALVVMNPTDFTVHPPVGQSLIRYHSDDIFVYDASCSSWLLFHQPLQEGRRHIKRLAVTFRALQNSFGTYDRLDPVWMNYLANFQFAILSGGGPSGGQAFLAKIWQENHPDLTDMDVVALFPRNSEVLAGLQEMFPNGAVSPDALLQSGVSGFTHADGYDVLQVCGFNIELQGEMRMVLNSFVSWFMMATVMWTFRSDVRLRLRFVAETDLQQVVQSGLQ